MSQLAYTKTVDYFPVHIMLCNCSALDGYILSLTMSTTVD